MSEDILTTVSKDTLDVSEKEAEISGNAQWVCFRSMNESQRWGGSAVDTMNTESHEHKVIMINTTVTDSINPLLIRQRDAHATDTTHSRKQLKGESLHRLQPKDYNLADWQRQSLSLYLEVHKPRNGTTESGALCSL